MRSLGRRRDEEFEAGPAVALLEPAAVEAVPAPVPAVEEAPVVTAVEETGPNEWHALTTELLTALTELRSAPAVQPEVQRVPVEVPEPMKVGTAQLVTSREVALMLELEPEQAVATAFQFVTGPELLTQLGEWAMPAPEVEEPMLPAQVVTAEEVLLLVTSAVRVEEPVQEVELSEDRATLYERRINKLNRALEDAQGEIKRLVESNQDDDGLSSIYREVQGLEDDSENKRELMAEIFKANLELRR